MTRKASGTRRSTCASFPAAPRVDGDGRLTIGGVRPRRARAVVRHAALCVRRGRAARLDAGSTAAAFGDDAVAYAGKAFLCVAMARLVAEEGLHLDVATGGEAHVASPGRLSRRRGWCSTATTSRSSSCAFALELGRGPAGRRLRRRARSHRGAGRERLPAHRGCSSRVTPGVEAHTHEYIATGADDSKFGFTVSSGAARDAAVRVAKSDAMELVGFHCHIGSQILVLESYRARGVDRRRARGRGRRTRRRADRRDQPRRWAGRAVHVRRSRCAADRGVRVVGARRPSPTRARRLVSILRRGLAVEAGRSIAGPAGRHPVHASASVKEIAGVRTYVAVDGGMSDNPRPVTYGARVRGVRARHAPRAPRPFVVTVAGKHCEQGDILVKRRPPACRPRGRRRARHAGHRGVQLLDGVELQPRAAPGGRVRPRRQRAGRRAPGDLRGSRRA